MNRAKNILSLYALNAIVLMFLNLYLLFGCKKIELERIVMVATGSVTNVNYASCSVQGTIIDKGEKGIDQHGFCWAVTQNPTTINNKTQLGSKSSIGNFSGNLTGLSANTTYYVRAYAQNKDGFFYGDQKSFSTLAYSLPTVTTTSISNITENSAQSGGNVTDDGGAEVTARGVCWSTSQNPTITDDHTTDVSGTGSFTSSITGLTQNTTYYVRAYATNSVGTVYGDEVNFTTEQTIVSPTVTTSSASDIAETSATVGGNVTAYGGATVTERGIYYSTSASPETTGTKLQIGSGTGSFSTSLTGLSAGTTYYIKAYATNSVGTAYGNEVNFTTGQAIVSPTVTTSSASDIAETSATVGGNVTDDGGAAVTERGIYYSISASPETTGTKLQIGSGTGTFSTSLTGLTSGTTYYIKAYAINSAGTFYGSEKIFITLGTGNFTDTRDSREYQWVTIGAQIWMVENLAYLPSVSPPLSESYTEPYYYVYGYEGSGVSEAKATSNYATYGVLYNWPAAMADASSSSFNPSGVQGVCPDGWHLPSDDEWAELIDFLGGDDVAGGKLKETGTTHWDSPNVGATNESGFTALPGGSRKVNTTFGNIGRIGYWWSATEYSTFRTWAMVLYYSSSDVDRLDYSKDYGFSVRCVRDY